MYYAGGRIWKNDTGWVKKKGVLKTYEFFFMNYSA